MSRLRTTSPEEDSIDPQIWLAEILRRRFKKIVELYSAPFENGKSERVHDLRVSIRKLRSALRDFAQLTDKGPLKKIRKKLKAYADVLGEVRDLDVAIEAFTTASEQASSSDIKRGIEEIVNDCRTQRLAAYDRLQTHLKAEDLDELKKQFDHAFDHSLRPHKMFAATSRTDTARIIIENRLDGFLTDVDAIYDPFAVRRIHRLRIAGKHLRYSIELFGELWNGELRTFADEIKKMQSYLGDLHDRDFWIAGSSKRISAERPRGEREEMIYRARIWLLSEFTSQRMDAYRNALQTWSEWRNNDFPGRLRKVIEDEQDLPEGGSD